MDAKIPNQIQKIKKALGTKRPALGYETSSPWVRIAQTLGTKRLNRLVRIVNLICPGYETSIIPSRYAQSSDIETVEKFNANDIINDSIRTQRQCVATQGHDRHSVASHLRDRLMPAVVTASNTPGTQFRDWSAQ